MDLTGGMSAEERERRRDELRVARETAERGEEAITEVAAEQGQPVPRRDPRHPGSAQSLKVKPR